MSQSSRSMDPQICSGTPNQNGSHCEPKVLLLGLELPFQWHVTAGFPSLCCSQAQIIFHWFSIMVLSSCQFTPVIGPAGSLQRRLLCACLEAQGTCERQGCSQACCKFHLFNSTGGSGHTSWEAPISVEWTQTQGRSLLLMLPAFRVFRSLSQAIELFPSSLRQETGTDQSIRKWFSAFVPLLSLLGMMLI